MSADAAVKDLPDVRPLHSLIATTRRLLRSSWVVTGLGLTLGLLLGTLLATTAADMTLPLNPAWSLFGLQLDGWVRLFALLVIVVPVAWAAVVGVVLPLFRRLASVQIARRIEKKLPGIHNRLVSVLDLDDPEKKKTVSPTFHRRLLTESLDRIREFRVASVLDLASVRKAGLFAFAAVGAFAVSWILFSDRLPTAIARIVNPFADIPPVGSVAFETTIYSPTEDENTAAALDPATNTVSILREEEIAFNATVQDDGEPKSLRVELYPGKSGETLKRDLVRDRDNPNLWALALDSARLGTGFEDGFRCRFYGGGTWSKLYQVKLVERPVIVSVQTAVHYPEYMGRPEPRVNPPQTPDVAGPEGGQVEVIVQAEGEVASGEIQWLQASRRRIPVARQSEKIWFDERTPTGTTTEGTWNWDHLDRRPVHTEPAAIGDHAHLFQGDPVGLPVQSGDTLFAHIWLSPTATPEGIMLQWHDGENWDHGAFWGKDVFKLHGKLDSNARRPMGPMPESGKWLRLEVPAAKVGVEGKVLRGMTFRLYGGQAFWGRAGAVRVEEPSFQVIARHPMTVLADGRWSGKFPLKGNGLYRAELRNPARHPNKPMNEAKFTSLVDQPPTIIIERPGADLTISTPGPVPLTVTAHDDYGLESIRLLVRGGSGGDFQERVLQQWNTPEQHRTVVAALDEAAQLAIGGILRYAVEARDRKGQTARTREFVLRVSADPNAADQQLAAFDKAQDPFRDRLVQLMGQQSKLQEQMEKIAKEYAETVEKTRNAEEKAKFDELGQLKVDPKTGKPLDTEPALKLDAETAKKLGELQKALAEMAKQEEQNAATAQALAAEMAKQAEAAQQLQLLPKPIADQMAQSQQTFQQQVAQAMRDFAQRMARNADPKQMAAPDLNALQRQGDRLLKELEAMKDRQQALAEARQALRDDLRDSLRRLQRNMLAQAADLDARELEELRKFLEEMREEMKRLQGKQEEVAREAANANSPEAMARAEMRQMRLDRELENLLGDAGKLLDRQQMARDRRRADRIRRPDFPDAPFQAEGEEVKVPPREQDTDDPLPGQKAKAKATPKAGQRQGERAMDDEREEEKFMPALGGKREKTDERFANKQRPLPKKADPDDAMADRRGDLEARQNERQADLDAAEKSLAADQASLEKMLADLNNARDAQGREQEGNDGQGKDGQGKEGQGKEGEGKEGQGKDGKGKGKGGKGQGKEGQGKEGQGEGEGEGDGQSLQEMLRSEMMNAARAMANRMKATTPYTGRPNPRDGQRPNPMGQASRGNMDGTNPNVSTDAELAKLDPNTRSLLLKMPPRLREDLLQGMREQGPDGYGPYIQNYFKRLTEVKETGKP